MHAVRSLLMCMRIYQLIEHNQSQYSPLRNPKTFYSTVWLNHILNRIIMGLLRPKCGLSAITKQTQRLPGTFNELKVSNSLSKCVSRFSVAWRWCVATHSCSTSHVETCRTLYPTGEGVVWPLTPVQHLWPRPRGNKQYPHIFKQTSAVL